MDSVLLRCAGLLIVQRKMNMHLRKQRLLLLLLALATISIPLGLWAYATSPIDVDDMPIGYVAQLEVSSFNLEKAGGTGKDPVTGAVTTVPGLETLYRTDYNRSDWSGDLHAYPLDALGRIAPNERWSAATAMANQHWDSGRFIATLRGTGTVAGIPFRGNLVSAIAVDDKSYGQTQVMNYVRGDSTNDTAHSGLLRVRDVALGDIVHSRPFHVADADNPTVFVGANDGMLHAFNADTGAERWAYIPSMLLAKLHMLALKHGYFVDGQINIGSITNSSGAPMRALFGGLGAGGKGLYALDISNLANPKSEAEVAGKVLWEIAANAAGNSSTLQTVGQSARTNTDYMHLGYTHGTPLLVKIDTTQGGTPSYVDALIVGNGYDDGAAGTAHLYVIRAATGELMKDFSVGPYAGLTGANGIFNPKAMDSNNDGFVDTVYGADLNGSLWKFDLSAAWTSSASWSTPTSPLFSNKSSTGAQPVTSSLGLAAHPRGGTMITFGTGSTLNGCYGTYAGGAWTTAGTGELKTSNPDTHYVYGIWDGAPGTGTIIPNDLLTQTLTETLNGDKRIRRVSALVPNWASGGHKGWKLALPAGERVVGEGSFIENGHFYFSSYNPTVAPIRVAGGNATIYGENWLMELNYLSGGAVESSALAGQWISNGVQSQPILLQLAKKNISLVNHNPDTIYPKAIARLDVTGNSLVTNSGSNTTGTQNTAGTTAAKPNSVSLTTPSGSVKTGGDEPAERARMGRISWRELLLPN